MTFIQIATGRAFELLAPSPDQVDFEVIAGALSRIPRFTGHIEAGAYSVAQHCVLGAELFTQQGKPREALAFLLKGASAAYCSEINRPTRDAIKAHAKALAVEAGSDPGLASTVMDKLFFRLVEPIDKAICQAAGMPLLCPWPPDVRQMDEAMLEAERRQLLGECRNKPWQANNGEPARLTGRIRVWSHVDAELRWIDLFNALAPSRQRRPLNTAI